METRTLSAPTGATSTPRRAQEKTTPATKPLTDTEKATLKTLETTIERGFKAFLATGSALLRIREERLYRDRFSAFDAYCRDRWGFSKTQANRFIAAYQVSKNLAPIGVTPTSESQVRLLSSITPAKQVPVFKRAAALAGGVEHVTAQSIQKAAEKMHLVSRPQASAVRAPADNLVKRADVIAAFTEWAEEKWDKVSHLSVSDFLKEVKKVVADA